MMNEMWFDCWANTGINGRFFGKLDGFRRVNGTRSCVEGNEHEHLIVMRVQNGNAGQRVCVRERIEVASLVDR